MKFTIKGPLKDNIYNLIREIGYHFLNKDEKTGEMSFIRSLSENDYPRFHLYLVVEGENLILNLHLDQKKPIYKGAPAHAAEYDGEVVEKETERIKEILKYNAKS